MLDLPAPKQAGIQLLPSQVDSRTMEDPETNSGWRGGGMNQHNS